MGINMGSRIALNQIVQNGELIINYKTNTTKNSSVDYCLIGVDYNNKLVADDYFVFYNNEFSREQAFQKKHDENVFGLDFNILPKNISKIVLTATSSSIMEDINSIEIQLYNSNNYYIDSHFINGNNHIGVKTIVIGEINNINGQWFIDFIDANFLGGMKEIVEFFAGEVEGQENNTHAPMQNQNNSANNNIKSEKTNTVLNMQKQQRIEKLVLEKAPQLLNMTKTAALVLEKKKIADIPARVAVVLDYSGSMSSMYRTGLVQSVLNRMLPIAMQLDDNGEMEVWLFNTKAIRLKDINLDNINNYIVNENILKKYSLGGTCYSPVMKDVVSKYTKEEPAPYPALVLFITDGDNFDSDKRATTKIINKSATMPIFWQFVGIGSGNFSYLEGLDEMDGRFIDNANFFSVNDIDKISDEELYDRLLNEFPSWIREARIKKIIR